jgi:hypothetical protein
MALLKLVVRLCNCSDAFAAELRVRMPQGGLIPNTTIPAQQMAADQALV